jgi:hypothetical protein
MALEMVGMKLNESRRENIAAAIQAPLRRAPLAHVDDQSAINSNPALKFGIAQHNVGVFK